MKVGSTISGAPTHMIGGCVSAAVSKGFVKLWHLLDKGHLECLWLSKKNPF